MPGGEVTYDYEVRRYAADDPKGEYQLWCNNQYERDYTVEDIFEDVRDLVQKVPDAGDKASLGAEVGEKKRLFDFHYDDCRYKENGQQAYQVITDFVKLIQQKLGEHDQNSQKVAAFLIYFTFEMCLMLQTFGPPGKSFEDRIQERLKTYYQDEQCPMQLKLAKLKRRGSE